MTACLNSWRASTLSLAGQITLAQSVLATIPSYVMQTSRIPPSICDQIDKVCRNFIWNGSEDSHNILLVSWEIICRPKKESGRS